MAHDRGLGCCSWTSIWQIWIHARRRGDGAHGQLVAAGGLTTLMVTHNMAQAIQWGNRLVMMHAGRIIFEVAGAEKAALTVEALIDRFHTASGTEWSTIASYSTPLP